MSVPALGEASRVWCRVALLSFGGPAGQIAVMHRIIVEEKRWVEEQRFLHALNFCMLLPGPEAQQLATYLGWILNGWRGGLVAGILFVLPGAVAILALSMMYARHQDTALVAALFFGLKPAVIAVVVEAVLRLGRRALQGPLMVVLAIAAFAAMFLFRVPFAVVLLGAAGIGFATSRRWPAGAGRGTGASGTGDGPREGPIGNRGAATPRSGLRRALAVGVGGLLVWWLPILILALALGSSHVFVRLGVFFGRVAVLSFGGAYAVLAFVAQEAVHTFHWLRPAEMLDGLGMAETTPGPLIMVVQFVGFMAAFRNPGGLDPVWAGLIASLIVTWVTFVPCFLWIFLGGPYVERLRGITALGAALAAITAAVVGVIMNLVMWFGLHVLFGKVSEVRWGPAHVLVPDPTTVDLVPVAIVAASCVLLLRFRWGLFPTLLAGTAFGALWALVRG